MSKHVLTQRLRYSIRTATVKRGHGLVIGSYVYRYLTTTGEIVRARLGDVEPDEIPETDNPNTPWKVIDYIKKGGAI